MSTPVQRAFLDIFGNAANSLSFTNPCAAGDSIVVIGLTLYSSTSYCTIGDNKGAANTYNLVTEFTGGSGLVALQVWLATNVVAGTQTITLTDPNGITFMGIGMWELPGIWTTDVSESGQPTFTSVGPWALPALVTNFADFVVSAIVAQAGGTVNTSPSPWANGTLTPRTDGMGFAESLQTVAGSITPSFSGTSTGTNNSLVAAGFYAATYSISGSAGVAGATVSWTGTASGSTTADGAGNYTIPTLANGSYTVTASKTGYSFTGPTPANPQVVSGANITGVNFTATASSSGGGVGSLGLGLGLGPMSKWETF